MSNIDLLQYVPQRGHAVARRLAEQRARSRAVDIGSACRTTRCAVQSSASFTMSDSSPHTEWTAPKKSDSFMS